MNREENERLGNILQGKIAVITGANRGIGRAIAVRLAADRAGVVLVPGIRSG